MFVRIAFLCFTWHQLGSSETWSCTHLQVHFHIVLMVGAACPLRSHLELRWEHLPVVLPRDCLASLQNGGCIPRVRVPRERKPGGESNLRSHVVSVTPPCYFGCGSHRVLPRFKKGNAILPLDDGPFHKKSMWDGYIGVAIFRKYFCNLGFIRHLEL